MKDEQIMIAYNATKGTCLAASVRVADSFLKRLVGLLGSRSLNCGMRIAECGLNDEKSAIGHRPSAIDGLWIKSCNSIHTLGMLFSIDVLFLNRSGQVVKALPGVRPFRLVLPVKSAVSVLELPEQTIGRTNTEPGDVIQVRPQTSDHGSRSEV